jgi:hypothetical protein
MDRPVVPGKVVANDMAKHTPGPWKACSANVRLIESAPTMYAAIESILEALQDRYDGAPDSTTLWMGQHIDDLKAAIGEA